MITKEIAAYCSENGKGFTSEDIWNDKGCYLKTKFVYCKCHDKKLVKDYPFKIKK